MIKKILAIVLALAMLGSFAACGDKDSGAKKTEHPNEITAGIPQDLGDSLDPYQMTAAGTREILSNVYEGLYKPNSDGDYVPAIAKSYTLSEDGKSYVFEINYDVVFHDGKSLTKEDLEYSFATCKENTVDSSLPKFFANAEVSVNDQGQLVIELAEPMSDVLAYLSIIYIIPEGYAEQSTFPVGTGPYKFVSRSVQENIILEKFSDYYGEKAKIDKITCKVYENATAMVTALNAGSIDLASHLTLDQIRGLGDKFTIIEGTTNIVQALYINNAVAPFDNMKVRQAMSYAINVDDIISLVAEGHGTKIGSSIYSSFKKYFDESLVGYYEYNPEKAKELLKEAGYENGFTMSISVPAVYQLHVDTAAVIAQQLKAVGITAELKEVEWNTWLTEVYSGRDFDTTVIGFDASMLTANALLERWTSGHKKNMINFSDPRYDEYMQKANASTDDAEQTELFKEAARVLTEDAANVYIQDAAEFTAMNKLLDGFHYYPLYRIDFSTVYFTE